MSWLLPPGAAHAVPLAEPDQTAMVNGPVHTIAQAGSVVWLGGSFTEARDLWGSDPVPAVGLVPVNDATGTVDVSVHIPSVTSAGADATVYDTSLGPDGVLYFVGSFSAVDGSPRSNVAAIDPATGALLPFAPSSVVARSVLATASNVFVGSGRLRSYELDGTPTPGFSPPAVGIDPRLRSHTTSPNIRDIVQSDADTLVVACQCDSLTDAHGTSGVKAVVEIDAATGDLRNWAPGGLGGGSAAFGISVIVHEDPAGGAATVYLAAGGSDFTAAYDASSGAQRWKTDTSGSSQAVVWYEGQLIVGGHFDWTQTPGTDTCGDNDNPDLACYHSPKLVAMDPGNGRVVLDDAGDPWNPGICCKYNGVWALLPDANGGSLHVGGEFTEMGGTWSGSGVHWSLISHAAQQSYGRLSDVASTSRPLTVVISGTGSGSVQSTPTGISCGDVCAGSFPDGSQVTLAATPEPGSDFTGWSGDCAGLSACSLTMDAAHRVTATFTTATRTEGCGRIAFVSNREGNNDIYTMNQDGSDVTRVTMNPASDTSPTWSPDCTHIAFASTRSGRSHLYVIGLDGTGARALTWGPAWDDVQPAWSPTGSLIAFVSNRSGASDIYVMSASGGGVHDVTADPYADKQPSWGPSGTRLVFAGNRTGIFQIYTIGVNSRGLTALTSGPFPSSQPAWSAGGTRMAFVCTSSGTAEVWVMMANGAGQTRLTTDSGSDAHPSWSRWGGRITYQAGSPTGPSAIAIIGLDGTGARTITDGTSDGFLPQWS